MIQNISHKKKNITLEGCKLFASLFVVFLHAPFPGKIGSIINTIGRFAVPFFFMISGFFSFDASSQTIVRRMKHIAQLVIAASLLYLIRYSLMFLSFGGSVKTYFQSIFTMHKLMGWFLLNLNPISDHLWFLSALLYCYILLWGYSLLFRKKRSNTLLYICGFLSLTGTLALDGPISSFIMYIPHYLYRNAWFMGFCSFVLGVFLKDLFLKYPKIQELPSKYQILLIAIGFVLAILQKRTIGAAEISFGALLAAAGFLTFCYTHPDCCKNKPFLQSFLSKAGSFSTTIYIIHILFIELYDSLYTNDFLRPLVVFLVSFLTSLLYSTFVTFIKSKK